MQLLFKREQTPGRTGSIKFNLWGKIELEGQETEIIRRYGLDKAMLIGALQPELLRRSIYLGVAASFGAFVILFLIAGFSSAFTLSIVAGFAAGYFYFDRNRETVFVRDLMHGRYFTCTSVVELARKEAWLGTIVAFLRQVMESAKHWDGTETVPIPVLSKDDAKELIIRGL